MGEGWDEDERSNENGRWIFQLKMLLMALHCSLHVKEFKAPTLFQCLFLIPGLLMTVRRGMFTWNGVLLYACVRCCVLVCAAVCLCVKRYACVCESVLVCVTLYVKPLYVM